MAFALDNVILLSRKYYGAYFPCENTQSLRSYIFQDKLALQIFQKAHISLATSLSIVETILDSKAFLSDTSSVEILRMTATTDWFLSSKIYYCNTGA